MPLLPLPENIPFFAGQSIARRWVGWMRAIHRLAGNSLDLEMMQAFADLNRIDLGPIGDQASLAVLDRQAQESATPGLEELKALRAADLPAAPSPEPPFAADPPLAPAADSKLLEYLLALAVPYREWSEIRVAQDTKANAGLYPAAAFVEGSLRREADTQKVFMQRAGVWVQLIAPAFLPFLLAAATHGALKRDGAGLVVRLGDDSANSFLKVLDEAYDATNWNGKTEVPTKNAIRDKLEQLAPGLAGALVDDSAFGGGWDGDTSHAPSRNAVYDEIAAVLAAIAALLGSSAYTPSNVTPDRSFDADATTLPELADVVGTVIADLQAKGILS
jgi:hypothetical protein